MSFHLRDTIEFSLEYKITHLSTWIQPLHITSQSAIRPVICIPDHPDRDENESIFYLSNQDDKEFYIKDVSINATETDEVIFSALHQLRNVFVKGHSATLHQLAKVRDNCPRLWINKTLKVKFRINEIIHDKTNAIEGTGNEDISLKKNLAALLESGSGADFAFETEGQLIPCHRALLCAQSSVFKTMFENSCYKENEENKLELDMSAEAVRIFLKFIYTDDLEIANDFSITTTTDLFMAGHFYNIQNLFLKCGEILAKNVTIEYAANMYKMGYIFDHKALKENATRVIRTNVKQVTKTEAWKDIKKNPEIWDDILIDCLGLK
jgi:hypothetical protein